MNKDIKLYGEIGFAIKANDIAQIFAELERNGAKNVTIHLHSEGGNVLEGNAIFNIIQQSSLHVKIIIEGIAASMASVIILAADEVEICENAFIMIHRPNGGGRGNVDEVAATLKILQDIEDVFIRVYSSKTGLAAEQVKVQWLNGAYNWLNADEAVKYGFANRKVSAIAKNIKGLKISSNTDAKQLYNQFAASLNNQTQFNMKRELIETFNLKDVSEISSDEDVLQSLVAKFDSMEKQVNEGVDNSINGLLETARKEGKIIPSQFDTYRQIGKTSGVTALASVLNDMRPYVPITSQLNKTIPTATLEHTNSIKSKSEWSLDDYRKNAPQELKSNPKLYRELIKKEYGQ